MSQIIKNDFKAYTESDGPGMSVRLRIPIRASFRQWIRQYTDFLCMNREGPDPTAYVHYSIILFAVADL